MIYGLGAGAAALAEGVENVEFMQGDATDLPFPDESFDLVTSNFVYHNITGRDKQKLLLETLRVLKKGGTFVLHDIMSPVRDGDMEAFVKRLKAEGHEEARLIDTTDGTFMVLWIPLPGQERDTSSRRRERPRGTATVSLTGRAARGGAPT